MDEKKDCVVGRVGLWSGRVQDDETRTTISRLYSSGFLCLERIEQVRSRRFRGGRVLALRFTFAGVGAVLGVVAKIVFDLWAG